jgi:hypothetical protein
MYQIQKRMVLINSADEQDHKEIVLNNPSFNLQYYLFIVPSGARLSPLGTAATVWPILPAPDDI